MNIEEIVRTSMDQLARELEPTVPRPAALRARVDRSRRIRTIAAVGLAAAVTVGVVVGVAEVRDRKSGSGPTPPVNTSGADIGVNGVWMADGVLHIGDEEFPQDREILTALVPVKGGAVYGGPDGKIVFQPVDGPAQIIRTDGEEQPASGPTPVGPAADPETGMVAILRWSVPDGRYDLFFYDTALGRQPTTGFPIGDESVDLPGDDNPFGTDLTSPIQWVGTDERGMQVALIRDGESFSHLEQNLKSGGGTSRPVSTMPIDVTLDVYAEAGPDGGVTFTTSDGSALSSVDSVEPDGGLSHDGELFAGLSADPENSGAVAVVDTHSGETRFIAPPSGTEATFPSWSSGHTLMFRATNVSDGTSGSVMACNADTLECATLAQVDDIDTTVLPSL